MFTGRRICEPRFNVCHHWYGSYLDSPFYSFMTERQREIYDIIEGYWMKYGFAPTIDNILEFTGGRSKSTIQRVIIKLCEAGHLKRIPYTARSVRPAYMKMKRPT